jgi:hypothetical protein
METGGKALRLTLRLLNLPLRILLWLQAPVKVWTAAYAYNETCAGRVHPKVISGILGHSGVALAMNTYDHLEAEDFRLPLQHVSGELLLNVTKSGEAA